MKHLLLPILMRTGDTCIMMERNFQNWSNCWDRVLKKYFFWHVVELFVIKAYICLPYICYLFAWNWSWFCYRSFRVCSLLCLFHVCERWCSFQANWPLSSTYTFFCFCVFWCENVKLKKQKTIYTSKEWIFTCNYSTDREENESIHKQVLLHVMGTDLSLNTKYGQLLACN